MLHLMCAGEVNKLNRLKRIANKNLRNFFGALLKINKNMFIVSVREKNEKMQSINFQQQKIKKRRLLSRLKVLG